MSGWNNLRLLALDNADEYEAAKQKKSELENHASIAGAKIRALTESHQKGPMGLTPDHIKNTPEYKAASAEYQKHFNALRAHNAFFIKKYAKQYKAERDAVRTAKLKNA